MGKGARIMAFTPITAGTDLFSVSLLNEIVEGLAERITVSSGTQPSSVIAGDDIQGAAFWADLQSKVEAICTSFYDSSVGIGGYAGESSINPFDEAGFFTAAGMIESGYWRRATAYDPSTDNWTDYRDPMFAYGKMQTGDIIGPWLLVDLQNALKQLLWTKVNVTYNTAYSRTTGSLYNTCADATAGAPVEWAASTWGTNHGGSYYLVYATLTYDAYDDLWTIANGRYSTDPQTFDAKLALLSSDVDCYEAFDAPSSHAFFDFDSLGVAPGLYRYFETLSGIGQRSRTGNPMYKLDTCPVSLSPLSCPDGGLYGVLIKDFTWIARWQFMNTD